MLIIPFEQVWLEPRRQGQQQQLNGKAGGAWRGWGWYRRGASRRNACIVKRQQVVEGGLPCLRAGGRGSNSRKAGGGESKGIRAKISGGSSSSSSNGEAGGGEAGGVGAGIEWASAGEMLVVERQQVVGEGLSCPRAGGRGSNSRKADGSGGNRC